MQRTLFVCLLSKVYRKISLTGGMNIISYITFSPPLSHSPSVCVCWRLQDSQRFMSVTLSKSDISLTTPRTGTLMHVHTHSSCAHTLSFFPSSPSPLCSAVRKHVSSGIHSRQRPKHCMQSIPTSNAEAIKDTMFLWWEWQTPITAQTWPIIWSLPGKA